MEVSASLSAAITITVLWAKTSRSCPILFSTLPERKLQNKCSNAAEGPQPDSLLQTSPTIIRAPNWNSSQGEAVYNYRWLPTLTCELLEFGGNTNDGQQAKYLTHSFSLTTLIVSSLNCRCPPGGVCTNTTNVCLLYGLQHLMASRGHRGFRTDITATTVTIIL